MIRNYEIAGIVVALDTEEMVYHEMCQEYSIPSDKVDMHIKVLVVDDLAPCGEEVLRRDTIVVCRDEDFTTAYYYNEGKVYGAISYDSDYSHTKVYLISDARLLGMRKDDIGYLLLGTLFNYRLTFFEGITLHGSAIDYQGSGIIFTAPSGVGKSTQANLWRERFGDEVRFINDDKPSLRFEDGELVGYGTPFAGKDHINANLRVPIRAIVNVTRGKVNKMERLTIKEGLVLLLEETTRSMFSSIININNMKIISRILESTPIYRLTCTPTLEAVEVTYDAIREVL